MRRAVIPGLLGFALICAAAVGAGAREAAHSPPNVNLVPYSGFDTGVYRRWRSDYQSGCVVRNADLDSEIKHDGPCSLRLRAYDRGYAHTPMGTSAESTFKVDLPAGEKTYTLSVWVRCDNPVRFSLSCGGLSVGGDLKPDDGWKRLTATGKLSGPRPLRMSVGSRKLIPAELHGGQVWVDSIQLEEGDAATDWRPAGPEVGLVAKPPFGIFHTDEKVRVAVRAANPMGEAKDLGFRATLWGGFGEKLETRTVSLAVPARGEAERVLEFPSNRTGIFRLEVEATDGEQAALRPGDRRLELPFYVLPKADPESWCPIGMYAQMNRPTIELASRLNLYWNNLLSSAGALTEWHKVWRRGELLADGYAPRIRWAAEKHHMRFIGCLGPSAMLERLPNELKSDEPIPGKTLTISHSPMHTKRHHIRLDKFREYLRACAKAYKPYVKVWQVVDECTFPNRPYARLCVETADALRREYPESEVLATYTHHMTYTYVRAGKEYCNGLYELGRTPQSGRQAVEAAELAGPDYPIYFYDCSIRFNYLSDTFNGWGKQAYRAKAPARTAGEMAGYVANFKERLDATLSNQIHPLGVAGPHAKALCLYHTRMPGGRSMASLDAWGHPAPLLVACGIFNALTPGGGVGPIPLDGVHAYVFSRGEGKGHLIAVHAMKDRADLPLSVPAGLGARQLDVWGNEPATQGADADKAIIRGDMWSYLTVPPGRLEATRAWLEQSVGTVEEEKIDWVKPERKPVDPGKDGLLLHLTMDDVADGTIRDASGLGNHAPLPEKHDLTEGISGKALDAATTRLTLDDNDALAATGNGLTVSCWITPTSDAARWAAFVKKDANVPGRKHGPAAYTPFVGWNLGTDGSSRPVPFEQNRLRFSVKGPGGGGQVSAGPMSRYVRRGKWAHVAATYDPDPANRGLRLYVNGVLVGDSVPASLPEWIDCTGPVTIGRDLRPWGGAIDNIRLYARPLSDKEVADLFKKEKPRNDRTTTRPAGWE